MALGTEDQEKFRRLYSDIGSINIPEFEDIEARDMATKVSEGIQIIRTAIKKVATIIK